MFVSFQIAIVLRMYLIYNRPKVCNVYFISAKIITGNLANSAFIKLYLKHKHPQTTAIYAYTIYYSIITERNNFRITIEQYNIRHTYII